MDKVSIHKPILQLFLVILWKLDVILLIQQLFELLKKEYLLF